MKLPFERLKTGQIENSAGSAPDIKARNEDVGIYDGANHPRWPRLNSSNIRSTSASFSIPNASLLCAGPPEQGLPFSIFSHIPPQRLPEQFAHGRCRSLATACLYQQIRRQGDRNRLCRAHALHCKTWKHGMLAARKTG